MGHFDRGIPVHKQLIRFVYLNDYIGRRNFSEAGVTPTPFGVAAMGRNSLTGEMSLQPVLYQWRF